MSYGTTTNNNNNASGEGQSSQAAGPSDGPAPPSYAAVVAGDHKVQSKD